MEPARNYGKNFMIKYTNKNSDALRHLTSQQFFEVWNNYDQDGELHCHSFALIATINWASIWIKFTISQLTRRIAKQNKNTLDPLPIPGNGYIEGRELDNFLQEFVTSIRDDKVS